MNYLKKKKMLMLNNNIKKIEPVEGDFSDTDLVIMLSSYSISNRAEDPAVNVVRQPTSHHSSFACFSIPIPEGAKKVTVYTTRSSFSTSTYKLGYGVANEPLYDTTYSAYVLGWASTATQTFNIDLSKFKTYKYVVVNTFTAGVNINVYKYTFE